MGSNWSFAKKISGVAIACIMLAACGQKTPVTDADDAAPAVGNDLEQIHQNAIVIDAHADIEIPGEESRYVGEDGKSKVAPDKMRAGGVDAVVMAIAVGPMPRTEAGYAAAKAQADKELNAILELTSDEQSGVVLARTADDVIAAQANGSSALILGFQNALILGKDLDLINTYYDQGVRVFALTHMGHNDYADSSRPLYIGELGKHEAEEEHGGLSELGRAAISRLNELGAVVDISQLSKAAALEVIALSKAPVIASHSNVRALTDVSRNLSDEEIDALAAKGGVIHIAPFRGYLFDSTDPQLDKDIRAARRKAGLKEDSYYPFELYWEMEDKAAQQAFLNEVSGLLGPGSIAAMVDHIDYIVQRVGVDHVGIGTDFNHGSGIVGFNDASEARGVTRGLLERGYSATDIEKIWGGNFLRVFEQAAKQRP
ncbi:MAG: dipeptidase [Pseudomonadales bacterium]